MGPSIRLSRAPPRATVDVGLAGWLAGWLTVYFAQLGNVVSKPWGLDRRRMPVKKKKKRWQDIKVQAEEDNLLFSGRVSY